VRDRLARMAPRMVKHGMPPASHTLITSAFF